MLSAESAAGKYPREAVEMMESIIREVEASPEYGIRMENNIYDHDPNDIEHAMIPAARSLARDLKVSFFFIYLPIIRLFAKLYRCPLQQLSITC